MKVEADAPLSPFFIFLFLFLQFLLLLSRVFPTGPRKELAAQSRPASMQRVDDTDSMGRDGETTEDALHNSGDSKATGASEPPARPKAAA